MNDKQTLEGQGQAETTAAPVRPDDNRLDWDLHIETPPVRPGGTIKVQLRYDGRSKPIPVPDPSEE
jgi:hypothetical protein